MSYDPFEAYQEGVDEGRQEQGNRIRELEAEVAEFTASALNDEARIRELEGYLYDQGILGKDYFERITKAKAILNRCNYNITDDPNVSDALAALEGK